MTEAPEAQLPDRAAVRVTPPLVPVATVLLGLGLQWLWPLGIGPHSFAPARYWLGGSLLGAVVVVLAVWPIILFHRSGQDPKPWKPSPELVGGGPYRISRNPMYLMMVLGTASIAVMLANLWILMLTPVSAYLLQELAIVPEEAYLERKFGERYRAYRRRVRRWI